MDLVPDWPIGHCMESNDVVADAALAKHGVAVKLFDAGPT